MICIWFPRHVFKAMVLFSAFVLRAIQYSHPICGNQDNLLFRENWNRFILVPIEGGKNSFLINNILSQLTITSYQT